MEHLEAVPGRTLASPAVMFVFRPAASSFLPNSSAISTLRKAAT